MNEGIFFNGAYHKSKFIEQMLKAKPASDKDIADIYIDSGLFDDDVKTCFDADAKTFVDDSIKNYLRYTDAFTDTETDMLIQALKIYKGRL